MLVYYCATNYAFIQVINGKEKGGSLKDLKKIPPKLLDQVSANGALLDHQTGDYYLFDPVFISLYMIIFRRRGYGIQKETLGCTI